MIHDKMDNLLQYIPKNKQHVVASFLGKISQNMEEGKYDIDGEDIYARIMSYETKLEEDCTI